MYTEQHVNLLLRLQASACSSALSRSSKELTSTPEGHPKVAIYAPGLELLAAASTGEVAHLVKAYVLVLSPAMEAVVETVMSHFRPCHKVIFNDQAREWSTTDRLLPNESRVQALVAMIRTDRSFIDDVDVFVVVGCNVADGELMRRAFGHTTTIYVPWSSNPLLRISEHLLQAAATFV